MDNKDKWLELIEGLVDPKFKDALEQRSGFSIVLLCIFIMIFILLITWFTYIVLPTVIRNVIMGWMFWFQLISYYVWGILWIAYHIVVSTIRSIFRW